MSYLRYQTLSYAAGLWFCLRLIIFMPWLFLFEVKN